MTLAVVGSVGIDSVQTPHGSVSDVVGGSAVYFSLAASLFTHVQVAANTGYDFPDSAWDALRNRGADLSGVRVFPDQKTFRWSGKYEGDMNEAETLLTELNVLAETPPIPDSYIEAPFVFLANMGPEVQLSTLKALKGQVVFADTMNLWIDTQLDSLMALLSQIDGLILNDAEARALTKESNLLLAGQKLLQWGPRVIVIKKGEHGSVLMTPDFQFALPAYPTTRVFDPTGAGDTFAGGFLGSLAQAESWSEKAMKRAVGFGTVAASITVEHFSTAGLENCNMSDIDERFQLLQSFSGL